MIAKGNLHANGGKLAAYLTTGNAEEGERAELVELRGFAADNIHDAFTDVQIQAEATRCTKPFFHAYVRLPEGEALTREQWLKVADRIEKGLGLEGQGRAVAFHHLADGSTHLHVAWSRIDLESMRAIDPGLYKNKLKEMSRELEKEFGLTQVRGERDPEQKTRAAGRNEFEQSRRLGIDIKAIRETIRDCWDRSDNGRSFEAALEEKGLILARGDRRDFVVIDRQGGDHAMSKRITGATAAETRTRLADLDRASLLSVTDARAAMRDARHVQSFDERQAARPLNEVNRTIWFAYEASRNGKEFSASLEKAGLTLARATAGDLKALDALRRDEWSKANDDRSHIHRNIPKVELGELVAVNRQGGIHRLDPHRPPPDAMEKRLADQQSRMPSITEARAANEIERERKATIGDMVREERALGRAERKAGHDRQQTQREARIEQRTASQTKAARPKPGASRAVGKVAGGILGIGSKFADAIATGFEQLLGGGPAVPPQQQMKTGDRPMPEPEEKTPHDQVVSAEEARAVRRQALMEKYGGEIEPNREAEIAAGVRKRDEDRSR